jgi:diguanylate cyclase (GGDEF)-like protein
MTSTEARRVVEQSLGAFFQTESGAIYLQSGPESLVETFASWNHSTPPLKESFEPQECWALRLGRPNVTSDTDQATRCEHLQNGAKGNSICIPMMANGHALGVFHMSRAEGGAAGNLPEAGVRLKVAARVAEMLSRAISNFRIREMLIDQGIRDPLTRLYNRRYMEDTLNREVHRARRSGSTIGVVMIDVDNFKQFNDSFGHPAGDRFLRTLADFLKSHVRPEDIPARYGGEEFALIMPGACAKTALARAKSLQKGFWENIPNLGRGTLREAGSFSCGVAVSPEHGTSVEELLQSADEALYRAKKLGKNCVEIAIARAHGPVLAA